VKNAVIMLITCAVLVAALAMGLRLQQPPAEQSSPQKSEDARSKIPYIGKIQVLNGCGIDGAAKAVVDFLRSKKFDVKNEGNAKTGNYPETLVVSRIKDQTVARRVAQALGIRSVVLMRTGDDMYDATVYVGADFKEHVR
jgi:hypothetical protein